MQRANSLRFILLLFIVINIRAGISQTNPETSFFNELAGNSLPGVYGGSAAWGDYDNDGDLDILLTGGATSNSISKIYCNNGNNTFTEQTNIALTEVSNSSVAWGDYDNDGDLDILLTGWANSGNISKIYRNNGNNTFIEQTGISLTGVSYSSVAWGDYDNDGDLDILLTGYTGSTNVSKIYRNNGNNTFTDQTGISLTGVSSGSVAWGDYDNDGDLDILLTGEAHSGQVSKIYRNNGDNTFSEQTGISLTGVSLSSVAWGDYDNDGDLDILLTGENNRESISKIYRNNGNNTFSYQSGIYIREARTSSAVWGDYDNDGDLDILVTGDNYVYTPEANIYRNNGNNTFSFAFSLTGVSSSSVAWGDYDNDGDLDILLTGIIGYSHYGVVSKIYRNDLSKYNTKPSSPTNLRNTVIDKGITLTWDKSTDSETSQSGLSYNVYVSSSPIADDIKSSMSNLPDGFRKIVHFGNAGQNNSYTIKNLDTAKRYYWSVQAVDHSFAGSLFATKDSFDTGGTTQSKANQTITFDALPAKTYGDSIFALTATSSSGLHVTYRSSNSAVAVVNGYLVTITGAGTAIITASQTGNSNYNAAPDVSQSLTVSKANQNITFSTLPGKNLSDTAFYITATASSGLPVSYRSSDSAVAVITGNRVNIRGAGTTTITASQAGNSNYNAAPDVNQSLTVSEGSGSKINQTITFNPLTSRMYGTAPFKIAAVSSSGLPVSFVSSNEIVASVTGNTVTVNNAGSAEITARQTGNNQYSAAPSVTQKLTVNKALLVIKADDKQRKIAEANPSFTLSYTGFVRNETELVLDVKPIVSCIATVNSPAGTYPIWVSGGKDNNYTFTYIDGNLVISRVTGISDVSSHGIGFYPNPATDHVIVIGDKPVKVKIYDVQGQMRLEKTMESDYLDLSILSPGVYIIRINNINEILVKQ